MSGSFNSSFPSPATARFCLLTCFPAPLLLAPQQHGSLLPCSSAYFFPCSLALLLLCSLVPLLPRSFVHLIHHSTAPPQHGCLAPMLNHSSTWLCLVFGGQAVCPLLPHKARLPKQRHKSQSPLHTVPRPMFSTSQFSTTNDNNLKKNDGQRQNKQWWNCLFTKYNFTG